MQIHNAVITGSFSYNGADLSNVTSSNQSSASLSTRVTQIEQVYATTGSNSFRATQSITGSLTVTGQIIAQTLNVQQVTSSIVYSSGSNDFGCDLNSRQTFTGSFYQTGSSATFSGTVTSNGTLIAGLANGNIRLKGSTDGFLGVGESDGNLYLADWATGVKGLSITLSTGAAKFNGGASCAPASSGTVTNSMILVKPNDGTNAIVMGAYPTSPFANWIQSQSTSALGTTFPLVLQPIGGNVGIGTSAPSSQLNIVGASSDIFADGLRVTRTSGTNQYGLINYQGGSLNILATDPVNSTPEIYFLTSTNGTTTCTRMVVNSNGNVGIGTTNARARLHVCGAYSSTNTSAIFANSNGSINCINYDTVIVQADDVTTFKIVERNVGSVDQVFTFSVGDSSARISTTCALPMQFFVNGSPAACGYNGLSGTAAITIASTGCVGIGNTSPTHLLSLKSSTSSNISLRNTTTNSWRGITFQNGDSDATEYAYISYNATSGEMRYYANPAAFGGFTSWYSNNAESMRLNADGYLFVGATTNSGFTNAHRIKGPSSTQDTQILSIDGGVEYSGFFRAVSGANYSNAATAIMIGRNTSTLRSINAGGTINASGADYAEYMLKATTDAIAKGDIVGVNSQGKLTNIFEDSVSFVVKSTDPSYVGGDTWGSVDNIGKLSPEATEEEKEEYEAKLETERAKVDRIAFSGQVPCNVTGATVGDYIIPIELENGKIGGQAVSNPTLEQYRISVGKVWKIMEDGRAWIAVKIG